MLREATEVSKHAQTKWIMVCSEENTYLDASGSYEGLKACTDKMHHRMFRRKYLFGCLGKLRRSQSMHRQNGSWYVPKKILIWMLREAREVSKHAQTKWIMVCSEENTYLDA